MKQTCACARLSSFFVICFITLAGCSHSGIPATTEELLVRYTSSPNVDNFHMGANVNLDVAALGVRAKIPVAVSVDAAQGKAHGTIAVDLSALDTRDYRMEFYTELTDGGIVCYLGVPDDNGVRTRWNVWNIPTTQKMDIFTLTDLLSASELTKVAKESDELVCYELTVPTSKVLQTAFTIDADSVEVGGLDEVALLDTVGNDKVRVYFTKDCLLRSIASSALVNLKTEQTDNVPVRLSLDVSCVLDGYGATQLSAVAIPKEVRDAALVTDVPIEVIEVIGDGSPLAEVVR